MKKQITITLAFLFASATAFAVEPESPSFDCAKASTNVEMMICTSPELASLDVKLATLYKATIAQAYDKASVKQQQIAWNRNVRAKCQDAKCIADEYSKRITELTSASAAPILATSAPPALDMPPLKTVESREIVSQTPPKTHQQSGEVDQRLWAVVEDMVKDAQIREKCAVSLKPDPDADIGRFWRKARNKWKDACLCESKNTEQNDPFAYKSATCMKKLRFYEQKFDQLARQAMSQKKEIEKAERDAVLAAAEAERKEKAESERKAAEVKQQEDEKNYADKIQLTKRQSNIVPERDAIWISKKTLPDGKQDNVDSFLCFGRVHDEWRDKVRASARPEPLSKGEFEKTVDYEKRVQLAQTEFATQKKQRDQGLQEFFATQLNESLGDPTVTDVQYNADSEVFKFNVISGRCNYGIAISTKTTGGDAPRLKEKLEKLQPSVAFELVGETLFVRYVALFDGQKLALAARPNVQAPYKFNDDELKKYKVAEEKFVAQRQAQYAEVNRRREAELMQKRWYRVMKAINVTGGVCDILRNDIKRYGEGNYAENIVNQMANENYARALQNGCVK